MRNFFINFCGASLPAWISLQVQPPVPDYSEAVKAIVSLVVGLLGAILTNWINRKLSKRRY